ncbi:glyoxalase [Sphingomonas populi]|uniref:Glyoxalase n=1 Tax=Sphingomonas populi TaxID=2484750 RepID=A0A4Q6XXF1_9SPHN|nr:glyoxalase [Sphingomonas populi]RZF65453.1 glyoxalase [Sphingomonas populi]
MKLCRLLAAAVLLATPVIAPARTTATHPDFAVGPQYDSTHVYVAPADFDRFMASFIATFGGNTSKQGVFQVTPTASQTISQVAMTPVGLVSVFGFKTPIPYPFGAERTGYLVTDIDAAVAAARKAGATRLVNTFPDPIGRDVVLQWPGGVTMQFYWHTVKPNYAPTATVPENRIYLTEDAADLFITHWRTFAHGVIVSDDAAAPGSEIGRPDVRYRRVRLRSGFGNMTVLVTDGALPWPYGREVTGYTVPDVSATLAKATEAGVETLVPPHREADRVSTMVRFPGGYIAEIHSNGR